MFNFNFSKRKLIAFLPKKRVKNGRMFVLCVLVKIVIILRKFHIPKFNSLNANANIRQTNHMKASEIILLLTV